MSPDQDRAHMFDSITWLVRGEKVPRRRAVNSSSRTSNWSANILLLMKSNSLTLSLHAIDCGGVVDMARRHLCSRCVAGERFSAVWAWSGWTNSLAQMSLL
ncbi:hypothetical protein ACFE04_010978 [Oxalis oulophora]